MPISPLNDVIVADSDRILRGILRSLLDTSGFNVLLAVDGLEAIDYATRTLARLVILEFKLPNLDGLAACEQIRRLPGYADVPIAILTSSDNDKSRAAAQFAGATMLIGKPFNAIGLQRAVALMLEPTSADVGAVSAPEPAAFVWERRQEPPPLYGEPAELSEGRRVLNICRLSPCPPVNGQRRD